MISVITSCQEGQKKRPLRIMQVQSLYGTYLDAFYAEKSVLTAMSYKIQEQAIFRDAFGAIHTIAPYLQNMGCETELVISNCKHLQLAWGKEHGITSLPDDWKNDLLRQRIQYFRPDVLYILNCLEFDGKFLRTLDYKPALTLGWRAADIPSQTDFTGYDIILSGLPRVLELAKVLGAKKGVLFHPGMPAWIAREVENIPQDIDVVFAGSISPTQHVQRLALLEHLAEGAKQYGFSLALHLSCDQSLISKVLRPYLRPPVFGIRMHQALRRGKIVFDSQGSIGFLLPNGQRKPDLAAGDTANMRLFEATGGGSLLLTEAMPGLRKYFEPGQECATYTGPEEALTQIRHYLAHPEERERVAAAGKKRCLTDWNMNVTAKKFLNLVQENLVSE